MKDAEECRIHAEALEALAEGESEIFRQKAYRQMAAYWRASQRLRSGDASSAKTESTRTSPTKI